MYTGEEAKSARLGVVRRCLTEAARSIASQAARSARVWRSCGGDSRAPPEATYHSSGERAMQSAALKSEPARAAGGLCRPTSGSRLTDGTHLRRLVARHSGHGGGNQALDAIH